MEYIEVNLEDIDKANRLANEVLGQSLDELAKPSRTLLSSIYKMVKEQTEKGSISYDQFFFNRRMIREYTNWTDWQIKAHIKQLEEMEYLNVRMGAQGKQYSYALNYKGQGEESGKCLSESYAGGRDPENDQKAGAGGWGSGTGEKRGNAGMTGLVG